MIFPELWIIMMVLIVGLDGCHTLFNGSSLTSQLVFMVKLLKSSMSHFVSHFWDEWIKQRHAERTTTWSWSRSMVHKSKFSAKSLKRTKPPWPKQHPMAYTKLWKKFYQSLSRKAHEFERDRKLLSWTLIKFLFNAKLTNLRIECSYSKVNANWTLHFC